jgi:hypothetical protein
MTRPDDDVNDDQLVERVLANRYRTLLGVYPRRYRAERGDEILGTLLDAARPGQRWPSRRDTVSMIIGGLRARAGSPPASVGAALADALYLAVFAWVSVAAVQTAASFGVNLAHSRGTDAWTLTSFGLPFGLCLATLLAVAWRRYAVALVALVAGMALCWGVDRPVPFWPLSKMAAWGPELSVAVLMTLAALAWLRHRPAVRWPVVLAVVALVAPYEALIDGDLLPGDVVILGTWLGTWALLLLPAVIATLLVVVEPRLTLAVAGHSVLVYLTHVSMSVVAPDYYHLDIQPAVAAAVGLVAAIGLLAARRQTRI